MAPQLAFVGIGLMGQAMTRNLVEKGNVQDPLILYNRTKSRAEKHSASIGHSTVADTLEEVISKSDVIWSCLEHQDAVLEVFDKILAHDVHGKIFLESSTILPEATDQIAKRVLDAGAEFVAMPVLGDPTVAKAGKLVCVPAGAAHSVDRIRPYLTGVVAQRVIDLSGEDHGKASLLKIIGNVMIMTTAETVAEMNVFAEKTGLGSDNIQKLIEGFPKIAHTIYSNRMISGEYYHGEPMVEVSKARALTAKVLALAKASNVSLKSYEVAIEHLAAAEAHSGPDGDITGIYGAVRLESGLQFENGGSQDKILKEETETK